MKLMKLLVVLILIVAPVMNASAADKTNAATKPWVTIPFVNYGSINDWRAVNYRAILIASDHNRWYKATFFSPCFDLPYALTVGFVTGPSGSLDKFSSILVHGHQCWFKSLEEVPAPSSAHAKSQNTG